MKLILLNGFTEYAADYSAVDHRPPTKSTVTGSWKSNAPHKTERPESAPESAEKVSKDNSANSRGRQGRKIAKIKKMTAIQKNYHQMASASAILT